MMRRATTPATAIFEHGGNPMKTLFALAALLALAGCGVPFVPLI